MKIADIIGNENGQAIYLHREGIFWRVYEYSAFAFSKNIKSYQVKKKFFKILKKEVVFLGFPDEALEQVLNVCAEKGFEMKHIL